MKFSSVVVVVFVLASLASAQTNKPSPEQLHQQAIDLMRAGQYPKAMPLIEQAYRATPAGQAPPRPLVLNRAMLDVMQKVNMMRAVKDLRDYLRLNPNPDDQATNLLGAAVQLAGKNPRTQKTDLFQSAAQQLDVAVTTLEQTRANTKKWGTKWYSEGDFAHVRFKVETAASHWRFEQDRADRYKADWDKAAAELAKYNVIDTTPQHVHRNTYDAATCPICQANRQKALRMDAARHDAADTEARYKAQQQVADRARALIPRPDWSIGFTPFDITATTPAPPPPLETVAPVVPGELSSNTPVPAAATK